MILLLKKLLFMVLFPSHLWVSISQKLDSFAVSGTLLSNSITVLLSNIPPPQAHWQDKNQRKFLRRKGKGDCRAQSHLPLVVTLQPREDWWNPSSYQTVHFHAPSVLLSPSEHARSVPQQELGCLSTLLGELSESFPSSIFLEKS